MKSDFDALIRKRSLQAVVVVGGHDYNAPRDYLTNGAKIGGGLVVKPLATETVILANPMEVEEAAKSGLRVFSYNDFGWAELVLAAEGNRTKAELVMWGRLLQHLDVPAGRIGVYGVGEVSQYIEFARMLGVALPHYQFVGEVGMPLFDEAYSTKGADELARIQSVAERTTAVQQATWDFISRHRAQGDVVVNDTGEALTIGAVRRFIRRELLDRDLEDTGLIFAQGRDGGIPHSLGEDAQALRLGQAIVFDLFPREYGGGYHHDTTRTWSIGYASDEVTAVYQQVMDAFDVAVDNFRVGMPAHLLQEAVQTYFEAGGHPTQRSTPGTTTGYVHGLGHGIGLNVHERPSISHTQREDRLLAGSVITIEPGLYYPDKGYGVRIEDVFYVQENGELVSLSPFHKELVLPLKG